MSTIVSSFSPFRIQLLRCIVLTVLLLSECDASVEESYFETLYLHCPMVMDGSLETNISNQTTKPTNVYPGDRIVIDFQLPQTISMYDTKDCTRFNQSLPMDSAVDINRYHHHQPTDKHFTTDDILDMQDQANQRSYQFQMKDAHKAFTFVCHDEGADVGCDSMDHMIKIQVWTRRAPYTNPPRKPTKTRSRSRPVQNDYYRHVDYGMLFLAFAGVLGVIALVMNCCIEYSEMIDKAEADRIACEVNNSNDQPIVEDSMPE